VGGDGSLGLEEAVNTAFGSSASDNGINLIKSPSTMPRAIQGTYMQYEENIICTWTKAQLIST
jgi:hypothetical protein